MHRPPRRLDNIKWLDPDVASTKRMVEGMEAMMQPTPWHQADGLTYQRTPMQLLADRIYARAEAGHTVHLKPQTAMQVAAALAIAPVTDLSVQKSFGYTVEDWTYQPSHVLAYCATATLSLGAWDAYAPTVPQLRLVTRWGPFTQRDSWRKDKRG